MRLASGLVAVAAAAVLLGAGAAAAPAARAAARSAARPAAAQARTAVSAAPAGVSSRLAEIANAATGADLWSRSSVTKRPIGSITKLMTAYVVLRTPGVSLSRVITVPAGITGYDNKYDASTAGLRPGERLTTGQLLYALLVPSGADAAYTLAAAYGPGPASFIAKMNTTARQLGLSKTHFTDFSGLPNPTEYSGYSTAHDLIALGRAAMKLTVIDTIVATREYKVAAGAGHLAHTWQNTNPLLGRYPGAIGIKSGYTVAAGQCLLFEARRGATTLIGVVLDSSTADSATLSAAGADATAMLNWAFSRS
jgi:D-alanyl-D-alanine carboxypeptidase (penicillin-binding protein 5/6)